MSNFLTIAMQRAHIVSSKIDLKKDFFSLNSEEMSNLNNYKKLFNYNGRNNLGRSELRQFYYHLQKGYSRLPF